MSLQLTSILSFSANGASLPLETYQISIESAEGNYTKHTETVTTSDDVFSLDEVSTIGYVRLRNLAALVTVTTPSTPVITNGGTPGAATWTYKIVAKQIDGAYSAASSGGTTTTGNADLDTDNFNTITWDAVPGAASYDVYRTAVGTSPTSTGLIATVFATTIDDTGLAGDASTAPSTAIDNVLLYGDASADYPLKLNGGDIAMFRWNSAAMHRKASTADVEIEVTIISD
jgi:hypothetical protein